MHSRSRRPDFWVSYWLSLQPNKSPKSLQHPCARTNCKYRAANTWIVVHMHQKCGFGYEHIDGKCGVFSFICISKTTKNRLWRITPKGICPGHCIRVWSPEIMSVSHNWRPSTSAILFSGVVYLSHKFLAFDQTPNQISLLELQAQAFYCAQGITVPRSRWRRHFSVHFSMVHFSMELIHCVWLSMQID